MEKNNPNAVIRIASILIFFSLWQISSLYVEVDLLPGPGEVFDKIILEAEDNEIFYHTAITLKRVFLSLL